MITKLVDFLQKVTSYYTFSYSEVQEGKRVTREASVIFFLVLLILVGFVIWEAVK